ncbi:hypothetical protein JCGZ_25797 [Jatropha curcas]|uniref:Pentacotripeptide-repeat region of PRORP domain-containing protein n=2 Tax=Jatropha curcas TaxID=180498 RepID=A0A067JVY2_JATCU|nr:pentatricopeptide repeat-containing protein At2g20710, mitochondrial isoform X1 [Jatropha curcas]KDP24140.1 hypothetical protein JCGZ_25797 [Jatropha curcas]
MKPLLRKNLNLYRHGSPVLRYTDLYNRISRTADPAVSMVPILENWLDEGNEIKRPELQEIIRQLRKDRRYTHALQISQWMTDRVCFNLSPEDAASQLDLISKVYGLEEAEKYFSSIPENSRGYRVYSALLNCYAHTKCLEKAGALMEKMKVLRFIRTPQPYNLMLNLYSQMGKYEKLDSLMQEMKEKGIKCDFFTFNIRLNAYVASCDIEGLEGLLMKMKADPRISMDFHSYAAAANGYLKAGLIEKALTMLKMSEQLISSSVNSKRFAYESLLGLYAAAGKKAEVYRIWNLYKKNGVFSNVGYVCMISSLLKLDDMAGAERIWGEWDVGKLLFDIRIPNLMIKAYCSKGLWEKAEALINKIVESRMEPNGASWDHMATGYFENGQMTKAVEAIKKAISLSKPGKKPCLYRVEVCLKYLKGQGDMEAVEELLKMIKESPFYSTGAYDRLLSCANREDLTTSGSDQTGDDDRTVGGEPPTALEYTDKGSTRIMTD